MSQGQLVTVFFLQAAAILFFSRVTGTFVQRWLGQPRVIGEMIAGVLLGPSLLGALFPQAHALIFPAASQPLLAAVAQLGVGLYMFIVGLGFDRREFASNARGAVAISLTGMLVPLLAAAVLSPWLLSQPGLFAAGVGRTQAALFLGAAIAITAFPMLARIIHERGISHTVIGTLSLAAGAIGDAGAWVLISVVLATLGAGWLSAIVAIGGGLGFAMLMIFAGPRLFARMDRWALAEEDGQLRLLAGTLVLFLLSAFAMDALGLHAVFGGFLLGTAMPRGAVTAFLRRTLEPVTVVLLLPFFFTYSGLHTELSLVASGSMLLTTAVVLAASIVAKGGASFAAARLSGQDSCAALGIGALMNARGLMELIVINIGLQRGIIGPALFSMLVIMAIVTTLMATPLFELSRSGSLRQPAVQP